MSLASNARVSSDEMNNFLEYAALFLANIGNYYVSMLQCHLILTKSKFSREKETRSLYHEHRARLLSQWLLYHPMLPSCIKRLKNPYLPHSLAC